MIYVIRYDLPELDPQLLGEVGDLANVTLDGYTLSKSSTLV